MRPAKSPFFCDNNREGKPKRVRVINIQICRKANKIKFHKMIAETIVRSDNTTMMTPTEKKELERKLIKSLAGKFGVSFKFAETFSPNRNYEYHERHFSQANEISFIIDESEDMISIQHILLVGNRYIKHWRQVWIYENREIWNLVKGHEWEKIMLTEEEAAGTWTQKVYQVDEAPRYEGYGTWVHVDGKHYWESTTDAALPRREITVRDDYNVLRRHSRIEILESGWMLEQDNEKIYRADDNITDTLICMEKGLEEFRIKNYDVTNVMNWWEERKAFWADVRDIWESIREGRDMIKIDNDMDLYMGQFALAEQFSGDKYNQNVASDAINTLIKKHLVEYKAF